MGPELFRALAALVDPPSPGAAPLADALEIGPLPDRSEHTDLFALQLVPYGSVYLGDEGRIGGEARDRIAGFWRALEIELPGEPDHLRTLLGLYADLSVEAPEDAPPAVGQAVRHHRRALLSEHLLSWVPLWLQALDELTSGFYARWGGLMSAALRREVLALQPVEDESIHARAAAPVPDAVTEELGAEAVTDLLLAPIRGGLILTRADLARAAREMGIGTRIGERRFMLRAMLQQAGSELLLWLAELCADRAGTLTTAAESGEPGLRRAIGRLERTGALLRRLTRAQ